MDIAAIRYTTQKQIEERILDLEKEGKFGEHVNPIDYDSVKHVGGDYDFLPHNPFFLLWKCIIRTIASVLGPVLTSFVLGARVKGRKNLRGLKGAVLSCNHVHVLDNMIVRQAVFGHTLYIAVAEFNNMKGLLGWVIRGAGTLPFSGSCRAMIRLQKTFTHLLEKGCFILGYPEQALWNRYEKPRPYHDGMFHISVKNNVPVVPMFITFREPSKFRRIFSTKKTAVLNILKPVYPQKSKSGKENISYVMNETKKECIECYTCFYGHAPEYASGAAAENTTCP